MPEPVSEFEAVRVTDDPETVAPFEGRVTATDGAVVSTTMDLLALRLSAGVKLVMAFPSVEVAAPVAEDTLSGFPPAACAVPKDGNCDTKLPNKSNFSTRGQVVFASTTYTYPIDHQPFKSQRAALKYVQQKCGRYERQACYCAGGYDRTPLEDLPYYLRIVSTDKVMVTRC
jgi:hypothetical protein